MLCGTVDGLEFEGSPPLPTKGTSQLEVREIPTNRNGSANWRATAEQDPLLVAHTGC